MSQDTASRRARAGQHVLHVQTRCSLWQWWKVDIVNVMNLAVPDRVQQVGAPQLIIWQLYATWARPASSLGQASAQSKYGEPHRKLAQ